MRVRPARRASPTRASGPAAGPRGRRPGGARRGCARARSRRTARGTSRPPASLARSGSVGAITVAAGQFLAAVEDGDQLWSTSTTLPVLDHDDRAAFVEAVAAEAGRLPALLAGELPHLLVEHAEESGVELLPYGGELQASCTCAAWVDPCPHALATAYQVAWLADADPFVLLALRGLSREELLARLHERDGRRAEVPDDVAARCRRRHPRHPHPRAAREGRVRHRAPAVRSAVTGSRDASLVPRRLGRVDAPRPGADAVTRGSDCAALRSRSRGNRGR